MLKAERNRKIIEYINQKTAASVQELAVLTGVSKATVRRDLAQLAESNTLLRTHGGAVVCEKSSQDELPLEIRRNVRREDKELVAAAASKLIREGTTIYIGSGSTGRALASKLGRFKRLTVLANDLGVAAEVSATDNTLVVAGGQLKKGSLTLYGYFTEKILKELHVDTAFMIVDAVDIKRGFMDYSADEVNLKRFILSNARKSYMLCDAAKFTISAFVDVCPFDAVNGIVTNAKADPVCLSAVRSAGLEIFTDGENIIV